MGVSLYEVLRLFASLENPKAIEAETGIKLMAPAVNGIQDFIELFDALQTSLKTLNPADLTEVILKKMLF